MSCPSWRLNEKHAITDEEHPALLVLLYLLPNLLFVKSTTVWLYCKIMCRYMKNMDICLGLLCLVLSHLLFPECMQNMLWIDEEHPVEFVLCSAIYFTVCNYNAAYCQTVTWKLWALSCLVFSCCPRILSSLLFIRNILWAS